MPAHQDFATMVVAAREGDRAAFEALVHRFREPIWAFVFALLRDRGLAEDAVQETFFFAYRGLGTLREPGAFRAWLYRIAEHAALTGCRRRRRRREVALDRDAMGVPRPHPVILPREMADGGFTADARPDLVALREAMGGLPPPYSEILTRHYLEGRSCRDMAEDLGLTLTNAKVRLHRARRALRARLEERGAAPAPARA